MMKETNVDDYICEECGWKEVDYVENGTKLKCFHCGFIQNKTVIRVVL